MFGLKWLDADCRSAPLELGMHDAKLTKLSENIDNSWFPSQVPGRQASALDVRSLNFVQVIPHATTCQVALMDTCIEQLVTSATQECLHQTVQFTPHNRSEQLQPHRGSEQLMPHNRSDCLHEAMHVSATQATQRIRGTDPT